MKRRVVVTGAGIVSCIGNDLDTVETSLREGRSGIQSMPLFAEMGLRSCIAGIPDISMEPPVDRKLRRFMGDASLYAYHAMRRAVDDSALNSSELSNPRTGLVVGLGTMRGHPDVTASVRLLVVLVL